MEGASEQPGESANRDAWGPAGTGRFGAIGCSGAIICSLGSEPCVKMGRLGAIFEFSGSGPRALAVLAFACATADMGQGAPRKVPRTRARGAVNSSECAAHSQQVGRGMQSLAARRRGA